MNHVFVLVLFLMLAACSGTTLSGESGKSAALRGKGGAGATDGSDGAADAGASGGNRGGGGGDAGNDEDDGDASTPTGGGDAAGATDGTNLDEPGVQTDDGEATTQDCSTAAARVEEQSATTTLTSAHMFLLARDHLNFKNTLYWDTADEAGALLYNSREARLMCNLAGYEQATKVAGSHYKNHEDNWIWQYQTGKNYLGAYRYDALKIDAVVCQGRIRAKCDELSQKKLWIDFDATLLK